MKWLALIGVLLLALLVVSIAGGGRREGAVNVIGSTSIQPFAEMLAEEFNLEHPECYTEVQGGGSTAGLQAAREGIADIGMCSRGLKAEEQAVFNETIIAYDGLAVVVHPSNPVRHLTRDQIRRLFDGRITRWSQGGIVGGLDRPVRLITREEGSGTREAFQKLVMGQERIARGALTQESNGAVKELVRNDPCAVGYMSLGLVRDELVMVTVDGVVPTMESVKSKKYPLVRPFLFVTKRDDQPHPLSAEKKLKSCNFVDYVLSPSGQKMLEKEGLVGGK